MTDTSTRISRAPSRAVGSIMFPASAEHVRAAREFVTEHLDGGPVPDAMLIVSELVTNSIQHGPPDGTITVSVSRPRPGIGRIEVAERGNGTSLPAVRRPDGLSESGRGLHIVQDLALAWGHRVCESGGLVTWAELPATIRPAHTGTRLRAVAPAEWQAS